MYALTDKQIKSFLNGELKLSVHRRYKEEMVAFCRNNCTDNRWYTTNVKEYIHFYTKARPICMMTKNHVKTIKKINKEQQIKILQIKKKKIEEELKRLNKWVDLT